jgi:hypothetical protein
MGVYIQCNHTQHNKPIVPGPGAENQNSSSRKESTMIASAWHFPVLRCSVVLCLALIVPSVEGQTQVTINALKDNTLYESATGALSNGAGQHFFAGRTAQASGSIRRGLVAFNITGSIPSGATITNVTLSLNMSQTSSGNQTVDLHRVLANWGEGTSQASGNEGGGAPATTGDATWLHTFYNTSFWSAAGGDYSSTVSASQTVGTLGSYTWGSTSAMVADVQAWLNTPSSNFGWILVGNESAASTSKRFDTRENADSTNWPRLVVTYTISPVVLQDSTGATVGGFSTITAAYNAIPNPITQRYLIEIQSSYAPASETLPLVFSSRTGSSAANSITIRPAPNVTGKTISTSSTVAVVSFDGADYVTLDGRPGGTGTTSVLTISNTATSGTNAHTIQFVNGATFNTVQYLTTTNGTSGSAGPRNIAFALAASNPEGNSGNLILNCTLDGGRTGVGSNGTAANPNVNNTVRGCTIRNWGFAGVWMQAGTNAMTVDSCTIYQTTGVSDVTNPAGITLAISTQYTATIRKNRIYDIRSTSTSTGLFVRGIYTQLGPGAGSVLNIENNFISLPVNNQNAATVHCVNLSGANAYTANVFYNSFRVGGVHTGGTSGSVVSAGLVNAITSTTAIINIKNNISVNDRTGGNTGVIHTGAAMSNTGGIIDMDYNAHYATAATPRYHAVWGTTGYDSLAAYQAAAAPNEAHSIFRVVEFVSITDLHLTGGSIGDFALSGTPIAGITTDIDGETRNATKPYMGADERPEAPLTSVSEGSIPADFSLGQNYPNPFNPATRIPYSLQVSGFTSLRVYDVLGREVTTLVNENLQPGSYEATWNAEGLSSGVYFYKLESRGFTQTRKMILMR